MELIPLFIVACLYFLPTILVIKRRGPNKLLIFILNLILGWTLLVWLFCIYLALKDDTITRIGASNSASSLKDLHDLLEKGAITEKEFANEKKKILANR